MLALLFASVYTIDRISTEIDPALNGTAYNAAYDAIVERQEAAFLGTYEFPWYCIALMVAFCFWGVFGFARAMRLTRQYYDAQLAAGTHPRQRLQRLWQDRVIIGVDPSLRPSQSPPGPSQEPVAPPPSSPMTYDPPMGSQAPTLYIPTYVGAAKPLRREITMGGTVIKDGRSIDPDAL